MAEFILEGALKLAGPLGEQVLGVLKQARDVFFTIVSDPIRFVRNLVRAVTQGFRQFGGNIWTHLKAGLMGWLFGALSNAGLEMPQKFDLKGIVSIVLQVLGLTYARLRAKLVKVIGEERVARIEQVVDFVKVLATEGIAGAWRKLIEYMGSLKDLVLGKIREWVVTKIVTAAVTKLVSMFNPAGAVIQAILAIYNTIKFFLERFRQIMALAQSVLQSIAAIAAGNIGAAADFVERSMARTLPVIISFLARLLGLGGISEKIKGIIETIRRPVDRALDKITAWIMRTAKSLLARGRAGLARAGAATKSFFFPEHRFQAGGKAHTLKVQETGRRPQLIIASDPQPVERFLSKFESSGELSPKQEERVNDAWQLLRTGINPLIEEIDRTEGDSEQADRVKGLLQQLLEKQVKLSGIIRLIVGKEALNVEGLEYHLEGQTGTFASMPKPKGDNLTADHQPQAAILQYAASLSYFAGQSEMQKRAAGRAKNGYAINLQKDRHAAGRTFKSKGGATKKQFVANVKSKTRGVESDQEKRNLVVDLIKEDLKDDVGEMKAVAGDDSNYKDIDALAAEPEERTKLKQTLKQQILRERPRSPPSPWRI